MTKDQMKRLLEEILDLKERIEKLADFCNGDKIEELDSKHQVLLEMQLRAMTMYMDVLILRVEHLGLDNIVAKFFED